jgi:hypothetical protein
MKKIQIENQFIETILCDELDKNNIKFSIRTFHDLAYNGLFQMSHGYGYIEIEDADEKKANTIYKKIKNLNSTNDSKKSKFRIIRKSLTKKDFLILAIILFIIISIIVGYRFHEINKKYSALKENKKKYAQEWNTNNTVKLSNNFKSGVV